MGLVVYPAYGREYKDRASVEEDWYHGRAFIYGRTNQYCSIRDLPSRVVEVRQGSSCWTMTPRYSPYKPRRFQAPNYALDLLISQGATNIPRSWPEWEDLIIILEEMVEVTLDPWHIQILLTLKKQVEKREFKVLTLVKP
tara:strand:+ start:234 stop:653 length:420 start_codon:yes stop_codon:yes gene_type:complete